MNCCDNDSLFCNNDCSCCVDNKTINLYRVRYDGVYIYGYSLPVNITVDTGATSTIVSDKIFEKIHEARRPELVPVPTYRRIKTASGDDLRVLGEAELCLKMDDVLLTKKYLVAEIEDDVLLGSDVLQRDSGGPVDLLLSDNVMKFRGETIQLKQVEPRSIVRRARAADHFFITGRSEKIVDVFIEGVDPSGAGSPWLLEAAPHVVEKLAVVVAPSLTDPSRYATVHIKILNPFDDDVSIKQDTVLAHAQEVCDEDCYDLGMSDHSEDEVVRRVVPSSLTSDVQLPEHLADLYKDACHGRSIQQQQAIKGLLVDYADVFSTGPDDLGRTNIWYHSINTGDAKPVKQPPRRTPAAFAGEDLKAIQKLQRQGVIRPSTSPYASPIVLVRKKDGTSRLTTDYRLLNKQVIPDAFPIPRTEDCLDAVAGSTLFSTMDITAAYHQIPMREEDIPKTAFTTKYGLFEYTTMPFGLSNATATFQRVMELALSGLQWTSCLIYLDDVIVFSSSFEQHVARLRSVLSRIRDARLKLKPGKCSFFKEEVAFLGFILSKEGVLPNPDNVAKVQNWPRPTNVKQVRGFIGLANFYRRHIRDFSSIARPMIDLTKKGKSFEWSDACEQSFVQLKEALVGPEVMAYPRDEGTFYLSCDASDTCIGCSLSQLQDGVEKVVAFGSHSLNRAERNYCVTDKELLAVKYFIEQYRHLLLGRRFIVRSDHQPLKWLFSLKEPKNRVARWIEILSAYNFSIEYVPGRKNGAADAMSRCPDPKMCDCTVRTPLPCGPCSRCTKRTVDMEGQMPTEVAGRVKGCRAWYQTDCDSSLYGWMCYILCGFMMFVSAMFSWFPSFSEHSSPEVFAVKQVKEVHRPWLQAYKTDKLRELQQKDPDVGVILTWKESGVRPFGEEVQKSSAATRHYWHLWDSLSVQDGVLCRAFHKRNGTGDFCQLIVPRALREEVMHQMHDTLLSGHLGQKKTREKTLQRFYWYGLREDVNLWVLRCDVCAAVKPPSKAAKAPMGKLPTGSPLDRLATDVLGPLPISQAGNKFILVVTDHFTKWVEIFAIPSQDAITCARIIMNEVIARFGCPCEILSDQGKNYESRVFAELCQLLEVRKKRTSTANPRCNGQSERFNLTLCRMIKAYLKGQQRTWDQNLGCLAAAYRATAHESTGMTPNLMMLGREVRLPAELVFGRTPVSDGEPQSYGEYVSMLRKRLEHAHDVARTHLEAATKRQKQYYDAGRTFHQFAEGDMVWYATESRQLQIAPKLRNPFDGPFLILKKYNDLNYRLQLDARGTQRVVHYNKLKPYKGTARLLWAKSALKRFHRANTK